MPGECLLRIGDDVVGDMADQFVGGLPCGLVGLAHDDMQADAEGELAAALLGSGLDACDLLGDLRRRLAPGQVFVDGVDRDIDAGIRRAAEIERRARRLHRREDQATVLDLDMLALHIDGLAAQLPRYRRRGIRG
jgi:hypothetical protein